MYTGWKFTCYIIPVKFYWLFKVFVESIFLVLICSRGGYLVRFIDKLLTKMKDVKKNATTVESFHYTYPNNNYEMIRINQNSGDVHIRRSSDDQIHVKYDVNLLNFSKLEESIELQFQNKCVFFTTSNGFGINNEFYLGVVNIYIEIPDQHYHCLEIAVKNGSIVVDDFTIDDINIKGLTGNVILKKLVSSKITVENTSGDTYIESVQANKIRVNSKNGHCETAGSFKDFRVNVLNGNVRVDAQSIDSKIIHIAAFNGAIKLGICKGLDVKGKMNTNFGELINSVEDVALKIDTDQKVLKMASFERQISGSAYCEILAETRKGTVEIHGI